MRATARLTPLLLCLAACTPDQDARDAASSRLSLSNTSAEVAPGGRVSQYSSLIDCRVTVSKPDEAGYRVLDCPGVGGYGLQRIESDGRAGLMIVPQKGAPKSLRLSEHGGGGFSELGNQAEWRGDTGKAPDALIFRYMIAESPQAPERWTSYLFVVDLEETCVAARIAPGPQQNDLARRTADGAMRCLT